MKYMIFSRVCCVASESPGKCIAHVLSGQLGGCGIWANQVGSGHESVTLCKLDDRFSDSV